MGIRSNTFPKLPLDWLCSNISASNCHLFRSQHKESERESGLSNITAPLRSVRIVPPQIFLGHHMNPYITCLPNGANLNMADEGSVVASACATSKSIPQSMIDNVLAVCPDVDPKDVAKDLVITGSATRTINRILDGQVGVNKHAACIFMLSHSLFFLRP